MERLVLSATVSYLSHYLIQLISRKFCNNKSAYLYPGTVA